MRKIIAPAALAALFLVGCSTAADQPQAEPAQSVTVAASEAPSPTAEPIPTVAEGPVIAVQQADVSSLPVINLADATAVFRTLPVDPNPSAEPMSLRLTLTESVPAYAEPGGPAVGVIDEITINGATVLPVFEIHLEDPRWVMVPVLARSGLPSEGVTGQSVAWIHLDSPGITASESRAVIQISLTNRSVEVIDSAGEHRYIDTEAGIGTAETPTPIGRSMIAASYPDARAAYASGLPIFATAIYGDRDAFEPSGGGGIAAPPLIALHFHDVRDGAVSNGCVRVNLELIKSLERFAPPGTPVVITQ